MSDLGTLLDTLKAESHMPGEEAAFRRHVISALRHYRPYRFLFSEKSQQFTLVTNVDEYKPGGETIVTPGYTYLKYPSPAVNPAQAFVDFGDSITPSGDGFSIGTRFRYKVGISDTQHIINRGAVPVTTSQYALSASGIDDTLRFLAIPSGGLVEVAHPTATFDDGNWHELIGCYDLRNLLSWMIYDGVLVQGPLASASGSFVFAPGERLLWGCREIPPSTRDRQFSGERERVVFWNRAVNVSEAAQMMAWEEGDEIPKSVAGFWPLTEGQGSTILDRIPAPTTPGFGTSPKSLDDPPHDGKASPLVDWGNDTQVFQTNFPGDIMEFDEVRRQIGTRSSVPLEPVSIGEMRELQASGLAFGQPDYWCWHHDRFIVWPKPSGAHVLTLDYHVDATKNEATGEPINVNSPGTVTNEFFRRGEELLRTRALYTYGLGRDDDYELAKRMKILNQEAERSLMRERDIMKIDGHQAAFHL